MYLLAEVASTNDLVVPLVAVATIVGVVLGAYAWLNRQFTDLKDCIKAAASKAEGAVPKTHLKLFLARLQIENPTLKMPSIDEALDH